jgi:hypothetical protein
MGCITLMRGVRNSSKTLVVKLQGCRALGKPKHRWKSNSKMDLKGKVAGGVRAVCSRPKSGIVVSNLTRGMGESVFSAFVLSCVGRLRAMGRLAHPGIQTKYLQWINSFGSYKSILVIDLTTPSAVQTMYHKMIG